MRPRVATPAVPRWLGRTGLPALGRDGRALRIMLAVIFFVHGGTRTWAGHVPEFGEFLSSRGFPLGHAMAWAITGFELVGATLLLLGVAVPLVALGFVLHQLAGIALVHARNGWFVVGGGEGGVEYSLLIIAACLTLLAVAPPRAGRPRGDDLSAG